VLCAAERLWKGDRVQTQSEAGILKKRAKAGRASLQARLGAHAATSRAQRVAAIYGM